MPAFATGTPKSVPVSDFTGTSQGVDLAELAQRIAGGKAEITAAMVRDAIPYLTVKEQRATSALFEHWIEKIGSISTIVNTQTSEVKLSVERGQTIEHDAKQEKTLARTSGLDIEAPPGSRVLIQIPMDTPWGPFHYAVMRRADAIFEVPQNGKLHIDLTATPISLQANYGQNKSVTGASFAAVGAQTADIMGTRALPNQLIVAVLADKDGMGPGMPEVLLSTQLDLPKAGVFDSSGKLNTDTPTFTLVYSEWKFASGYAQIRRGIQCATSKKMAVG